MQAESLLPALEGQAWAGRSHVFAEQARDDILTETEYMTMIRSREFKLVHFLDEPFGQLFDLDRDPSEVNNLWNAAEAAETKQGLLAELREWRIRSQYRAANWAEMWR